VSIRRTTAGRSAVDPRINELDDRFADNLRAMRTKLKVSRGELALRAGIPEHSIEKVETGHGTTAGMRRRVTIGEAVALAEALGVKPGELLQGGGS
jgi:transcriptional regulator with XRE-family HTH domain